MPPHPYPLTQAWAQTLPRQGLASFPECVSSTRLPRIIAAAHADLPLLPGLLPAWRKAISEPMEADGWMPEAHVVLQQLLLRDTHFSSDTAFFAATKARVKDSFLHPAMRPLMALMSPHLLILGASRRWAAYHRGTELSVTSKSAKSLTGTLTFPAGLFPPLMIEDTRVAIEASIELTGKSIRTLTVAVVTPGVCAIEGSWD